MAGERTWCDRRDDGSARCRGAFAYEGPGPDGAWSVTDAGLCGRGGGAVSCVHPVGGYTAESPFVAWLSGPGAPCGRTAGGEVWCATHDVDEGADAELVAVPSASPADGLGSDGESLYVLERGGVVRASRPPAHGGGRARVVAQGATALASDGWTAACWTFGASGACADGRVLPAAQALAVGAGVVCGTGPSGTWCDGMPSPGDAPADEIVAGTGFVCARRGQDVGCAGSAPD